MYTQKQRYQDMSISIYARESVEMDGRRDARAHPGGSSACAQCRALDSPAAWLRSWVRLTPDTACGRAQSALHGTGCDHAVRACEGQAAAGDRAPLDFEDGEMAASRTTSLASLPPTEPRRAWQIANSASQLPTSGRTIWAWHMTPNVSSATSIAARLLQRTRDGSAAAIATPCVCLLRRTDTMTKELGLDGLAPP